MKTYTIKARGVSGELIKKALDSDILGSFSSGEKSIILQIRESKPTMWRWVNMLRDAEAYAIEWGVSWGIYPVQKWNVIKAQKDEKK